MMAMQVDPVCGMEVQPENSAGQSEYKGHTFYFCCPECKEEFDEDPDTYVELPTQMSNQS